MPHTDIINDCKKVTVQYLIDKIGTENLVSIILYGSVARNEESYKIVNGKVFLESDLDVLVVVKNKISALRSLIGLKQLSEELSGELRKEGLLSYVNLSITAENRFLNARPNAFHLHLKLNGKVIYGKDLIVLMPSYEYDQYTRVPVDTLSRMILGHMIFVVRSLASSGIVDGRISLEGYNSVLKSIRKLTLFMLRSIIIKNSIPVNPYDLTEIRDKRNLFKTINSICNDLLNSYETTALCDSKNDCSVNELQKRLITVISQFSSTLEVLTGINCPLAKLPKKLVFGQFPFIRRLEYSLYILLTNLRTSWTIGLFKFLIHIILGPEGIYITYHNLFVSSANLLKSPDSVDSNTFQQRQSWLKLYRKSVKPWKYDKAAG